MQGVLIFTVVFALIVIGLIMNFKKIVRWIKKYLISSFKIKRYKSFAVALLLYLLLIQIFYVLIGSILR